MKTCKLCNKTIQDNWIYCNDKLCNRLRHREYYMAHKPIHYKYSGETLPILNWSCDCFGGLGFIIPLSFTKCVACKARQKKGYRQPRYHKLFNPNIHAVTLASFFEEKEKASIKAIEKVL